MKYICGNCNGTGHVTESEHESLPAVSKTCSFCGGVGSHLGEFSITEGYVLKAELRAKKAEHEDALRQHLMQHPDFADAFYEYLCEGDHLESLRSLRQRLYPNRGYISITRKG